MRGPLVQEMFNCIPEIDFAVGYRYFLGNMDNYAKALLSTLKSVKAKLPILSSMCHTDEYEGLRIITSTLRIMLGNVGAVSLSEDTYQIETALLNNNTAYLREQLAGYISGLAELSANLELLLKDLVLKNTSSKEESTSFLKYDFTKTKESIIHSSNYIKRKII